MSPPLVVVTVLVLLLVTVSATPLEELRQRCAGRRDGKDCLMASLAAYVDGVADPGGDVDLWSGGLLRLSKVPEEEARMLDEEEVPEEDATGGTSEALLGRVVADKLWGVAKRRALVWGVTKGVEVRVAPVKDGVALSLAEVDTHEEEQEFTGRRRRPLRRRRRKGALSLLLAAAALKLSTFGAILLKGVAVLVTKAILVSKLALLVTLLGWAAKLSTGTQKKRHVTYEVLSHPQKVEHGAGEVIYPHPPPGWGRSSHELVYNAHQPPGTDNLHHQ